MRMQAVDLPETRFKMPIMKRPLFSGSLCGVLVAMSMTGCAAPPREGEPISQSINLSARQSNEALWTAAEDTLRENGFDIEVIDRRAGYIATAPQTSQQFFEFWRSDVATPHDFVESSLRTVRRRVRVDIAEEANTSGMQLTVRVARELFATPERQFNNSVAAFRMFGSELPGERSGRPVSPADDYWIDGGRDLAMEQRLLDAIVMRCATDA